MTNNPFDGLTAATGITEEEFKKVEENLRNAKPEDVAAQREAEKSVYLDFINVLSLPDTQENFNFFVNVTLRTLMREKHERQSIAREIADMIAHSTAKSAEVIQ